MVLLTRTGFLAAVAAAAVFTVPEFAGRELRAEERINWLNSQGAVARNWPTRKPKTAASSEREAKTVSILDAPPPLPTPPSLPPQPTAIDWLGDRLVTSVFKIEGYEAQVQVLSDGTINLPRLGTVDVWGLTLEEPGNASPMVTANFCVAPSSISILFSSVRSGSR